VQPGVGTSATGATSATAAAMFVSCIPRKHNTVQKSSGMEKFSGMEVPNFGLRVAAAWLKPLAAACPYKTATKRGKS